MYADWLRVKALNGDKGEHEQNAHSLNLKNCINVKNHTGKATRGKFLRFGNLQKIMKSGVW